MVRRNTDFTVKWCHSGHIGIAVSWKCNAGTALKEQMSRRPTASAQTEKYQAAALQIDPRSASCSYCDAYIAAEAIAVTVLKYLLLEKNPIVGAGVSRSVISRYIST